MQYDSAWAGLLPAYASAARAAPRVVVYLHIPKSAGSSVTRAMRKPSSGWTFAALLPSRLATQVCLCGDHGCETHGRRLRDIGDLAGSDSGTRPLFLNVGHERYAAVTWLRRGLEGHGCTVPSACIGLRPTRHRLASMFADYWTQVDLAERIAAGEVQESRHRALLARRNLEDSRHYRRADGSIDGVAWFRAFARHGTENPFFLSEVFEGSVSLFEDEVSSGRLRLVPIQATDAFLAELTGRDTHPRARVSRRDAPDVDAALAEASGLLDELASRDAGFESAAARLLAASRPARSAAPA